MSLFRKVKAVEKVFRQLGEDVSAFKETSKLKCLGGCGECCKKPDIEATVLEFLPLAYYLYKSDKAWDFLEMLKSRSDNHCSLFSPFLSGSQAGFCSNYEYRGLICRLFGFSAKLNKAGEPELSTCRLIKEKYAETYVQAVHDIKSGAPVPVMRDYYMRLYAIDIKLTERFYPVNTAMKHALETVLAYYTYRNRKAG